MKRRRFITTVIVSAALTGGLLTACDRGGTGTAGGGGRPVLTLATSADYPPYEFVETSGGTEEIVGFDIDIARTITDRLGYDLEISNIDFSGLIPALQSGRADFVMAGMTPTEERRQNVDFSEIYYTAQQTIVSQQNSGIDSPEALAGRRVGVQLGSIQEKLARELQTEGGIAMEIVSLNRINEIIQEVRAGRIDAAIIEDTVAEGFLQANAELQAVEIPEEGPAGSAIAFPQGSELVEDFNRVLQEMQQSGEIEELVVKWFGDGGSGN